MARRIRKTTAVRRDEVVKAVLRIIGERGLTSLSTSTLASEVGLTTGALFRHFPTIEAMLQETVVYALSRIEGTFPDRDDPPFDRLIALARNRVRLLVSEPGISWLLRSEQAYLSLPTEAVEKLREMSARSQRFLVDAIREGAAEGTIRNDIEPEILIVPVIGTIHALAGMPGVRGRSTKVRQRQTNQVIDALKLILAPTGTIRARSQAQSRT